MQILLSPAKDMTETSTIVPPFTSTPHFQREATDCAMQMSEFTAEELSKLLKINPKLSALTAQRYHNFLDPEPHLAAILSYTGMAYRHLQAEKFSEADFRYAQKHLWITSFLYGLNRPLDEIKNYRLEGNVQLPEHDGQSIFQFWRPLLTRLLIDSVQADDGILIHAASAEMKSLFDWKRVAKSVRIITPEFYVDQGDRLKTIVVYAKMMRGALARHLITTRPISPEALCDFAYEGFAFRPEHSTADKWAWVLG